MATPNGHPANSHGSHNGHSNGNGNGNGRPSGSRNASPESIPVDWERLARATAHHLRISILEVLGLDGGRVLSPSDLSHELQIPLSNTNYHVTELAKGRLIELCGQRQVRGATEHFYRLPGTEASPSAATSAGSSALPTAA